MLKLDCARRIVCGWTVVALGSELGHYCQNCWYALARHFLTWTKVLSWVRLIGSPRCFWFHGNSRRLESCLFALSLLHRQYMACALLVHLQYTPYTAMSTTSRQMTIRLPQIELDRIEAYSKRTGRTKTDILREFIRSLPDPEPEPESKPEKK